MRIKIFTPNENGKIELSKEELENLLNETYYYRINMNEISAMNIKGNVYKILAYVFEHFLTLKINLVQKTFCPSLMKADIPVLEELLFQFVEKARVLLIPVC